MMQDNRPQIDLEDKPKACCINLRCKSMFYRTDERPGRLHDEDAMGYWCSATGDGVGPDKLLASVKKCQEGRGCFKARP